MTVEVAAQVSNLHAVRFKCPRGFKADESSAMRCYLPLAPPSDVSLGPILAIVVSLSIVVLLGAAWTRRLYREKSASRATAMRAAAL